MRSASFWLLALFSSACSNQLVPIPEEEEPSFFVQGADISFLPELRSHPMTTRFQGQPEDPLLTLKRSGVNVIRLRLWKQPAEETSSFSTVKKLSAEIKNLGLKTLISVHYSDTWADPGKQTKPLGWKNITGEQLQDSVYAYTRKIMEEIKPDFIQLGNEINGGFLWPDGNYENILVFKLLLKKAALAVRQVNPKTKIILHYAGIEFAESFFTKLSDIDYDIMGLSYYPIWHGKDLNKLKEDLARLTTTMQKSVLIAEMAYPFSLGWNDWTNNIVGLESQLLSGFPATPKGQKEYVLAVKNLLKANPKSIGFCYWGAEWISFKGNRATNGSSWENQAFWDFNNDSLPVLEAYQ